MSPEVIANMINDSILGPHKTYFPLDEPAKFQIQRNNTSAVFN